MTIFSRKPEQAPADPAVVGHQWTMGSQMASTAVTGLLWVAIALGPVAFAVSMWQATHPVAPSSAAMGLSSEAQSRQLVAGEFATRAVTVWLGASRGQEDLVHTLLPASSGQMLPEAGMQVADAMPVGYVDAGNGVWAVTVAATVTDARMVSRRFFTLPVQVAGSTVSAVAMPAEVPSTALAAAAPALDYSVAVPPSSPVVTTSTEFLAAYLAGSGDVARVVAPRAAITAVQPAPFTAVRIGSVAAHSEIPDSPADGARVDVLVTAVAQVGGQQAVSVQYSLTLTARAGRWEVSQVRSAPLLAAKQPTATPSVAPAVTASPAPSTPSTSSTQK
ncbi:conjugal transfer protein [Propionicimonas sp.]|uniref:conjugal transfer protein n=1 Tax=Propionicimonas sp. TaxID=1955623 RepID=UPI00180DCA73|nr:conjugal transfer protein [Propionicimonas sp.]MBA3019635.1 conjugal transfer protein [Propionicimonas sp.]MBU4208020.1 conjugal transfer protein [Actinomycetota bacterium]MCG2805754.1 conjugal transfer protein [Propionicimonas sp.]